MKLRSILLFMGCLVVSSCVPTQVLKYPSATCRVIDSRTRRPIKGAQVFYPDWEPRVATTDSDGRFYVPARYERPNVALISFHHAQHLPVPMQIYQRGYNAPLMGFGTGQEQISAEISLDPLTRRP